MKIPDFSGIVHEPRAGTTPGPDPVGTRNPHRTMDPNRTVDASGTVDSRWSQASGPFRITPQLVLTPTCVSDVVAAVRWARHEGRNITTRAAGTGMPGGNVGDDVVLDLGPIGGLAKIGPIDVEARRVVVGPGAVAADVDRAARSHGLSLPALPSSADRCTVGGMVANNAAGARSFRHGAISARVAALSVVDAEGRVHSLERRVASGGALADDPFSAAALAVPGVAARPGIRKNSSGYGLDRYARSGDSLDILVGSEGTLGVIVEVELNLAAPPARRRTVLVGAETDEVLIRWTEIARELDLSACEFIGPWLLDRANVRDDDAFGAVAGGARHVLILEAEGTDEQVAWAVDAVQKHARALSTAALVASSSAEQKAIWSLRKRASPAIAQAAGEGKRSMQFIEDSVVPPEALGQYLDGVGGLLDDVGFEAAIFGHAGDANVHINPLVPVGEHDCRDRVERLLRGTATLVAALGGTLAGEHGDGRVRAPFLEEVWGAPAYRSFVALKRAVDPDGTFNPGVIVPIPGQDPLRGLTTS